MGDCACESPISNLLLDDALHAPIDGDFLAGSRRYDPVSAAARTGKDMFHPFDGHILPQHHLESL